MLFILRIFVYFLTCLVIAAYLSLFERKLIARIQLRKGPDQCGWAGIFQPLADALKLLSKSVKLKDYSKLSVFAVILMMTTSLIQLTLIPISNDAFSPNYGLIFVLICHGVIVFSEIILGISQQSKYGIIGGNRAYLQLLGSHIPFILCIIITTIIFKTLNLNNIVATDINTAKLVPLFIIFFVVLLISGNRVPFDFVEAESEIIAGAYVEYGGILFAMIYLSDYLNLLFTSAFISTIFFGGYNSPLLPSYAAILFKTLLITSVIILIRAILPRYRQDQMIKISWMILIPLLLIYILVFI